MAPWLPAEIALPPEEISELPSKRSNDRLGVELVAIGRDGLFARASEGTPTVSGGPKYGTDDRLNILIRRYHERDWDLRLAASGGNTIKKRFLIATALASEVTGSNAQQPAHTVL
jgi:hypothetical protein